MVLPFAITYLCGTCFSALVMFKTKTRNCINFQHDIRCALTRSSLNDKFLNIYGQIFQVFYDISYHLFLSAIVFVDYILAPQICLGSSAVFHLQCFTNPSQMSHQPYFRKFPLFPSDWYTTNASFCELRELRTLRVHTRAFGRCLGKSYL